MSESDERPITRTDDLPAHGTTVDGFDGTEIPPAAGVAVRMAWCDWLWINTGLTVDLLITFVGLLVVFVLRYTAPSVGVPAGWVVAVLLLFLGIGRILGFGGYR